MTIRPHSAVTLACALSVALVSSCTRSETPPAPAPTTAAAEKPKGPATAAEGTSIVVLELANDVKLGALQIDVDYSRATGRVAGDGDQAECKATVAGALSSYNNMPGARQLKAAIVAVQGIQGPTAFAECTFQGQPTADQFTVAIADVSTPDLTAPDTEPQIKVSVRAQ
jgi:hypothetical protein